MCEAPDEGEATATGSGEGGNETSAGSGPGTSTVGADGAGDGSPPAAGDGVSSVVTPPLQATTRTATNEAAQWRRDVDADDQDM